MLNKLILGIAIALLGVTVCAAKPLTLIQFRDAYADEVRHDFPAFKIKVLADDELEITNPSGEVVSAFMDNAFAFYKENPGKLREILKNYSSIAVSDTNVVHAKADQLTILVRSAQYLSSARSLESGAEGAKEPPLNRPLAGDLVAYVAVDLPQSYQFLPANVLRSDLKMDDQAIWARALANLRHHLPATDLSKQPIFALTVGNGLASSLLVESEVWDAPAMQVGGAPVVAPIAKDLIVVAHEGDAKGIANLREAAAKGSDDPDSLSTALFVRRKGAWVELPP